MIRQVLRVGFKALDELVEVVVERGRRRVRRLVGLRARRSAATPAGAPARIATRRGLTTRAGAPSVPGHGARQDEPKGGAAMWVRLKSDQLWDGPGGLVATWLLMAGAFVLPPAVMSGETGWASISARTALALPLVLVLRAVLRRQRASPSPARPPRLRPTTRHGAFWIGTWAWLLCSMAVSTGDPVSWFMVVAAAVFAAPVGTIISGVLAPQPAGVAARPPARDSA